MVPMRHGEHLPQDSCCVNDRVAAHFDDAIGVVEHDQTAGAIMAPASASASKSMGVSPMDAGIYATAGGAADENGFERLAVCDAAADASTI